MPASAPTERAFPLPLLIGLTLLNTVKDVVSTTVEDGYVVDDTGDNVADVPSVAAIVIAPDRLQHAVFPLPQHQVVELPYPEQGVTCALPFTSYAVPRISPQLCYQLSFHFPNT
jgi:hypothetical protein